MYCLYRLTGVDERKCWEIILEMFGELDVDVGETVLGGGCCSEAVVLVASGEDGVSEVM